MVDTLISVAGQGAMLRRTGQALRERGPFMDETIVRLSEAELGDIATRLANLLQSINQGSDAAVPESAKRVDHLHAEAIVIVTGLRSRPELNGKRGRIVGRDATTFRFKVQIEGEPGPLGLKPDNLMAPSRDRPRDVMGDEAEDEKKFDAQAFSRMSNTLFHERRQQVLKMVVLQGWSIFDCMVVIDCRQTTSKRTVLPVLMDTLPQYLDSIGLEAPADPGAFDRYREIHERNRGIGAVTAIAVAMCGEAHSIDKHNLQVLLKTFYPGDGGPFGQTWSESMAILAESIQPIKASLETSDQLAAYLKELSVGQDGPPGGEGGAPGSSGVGGVGGVGVGVGGGGGGGDGAVQAARARALAWRAVRGASSRGDGNESDPLTECLSASELMRTLPPHEQSLPFFVAMGARLVKLTTRADSAALAAAALEVSTALLQICASNAAASEVTAALEASLASLRERAASLRRECKCCGEVKGKEAFSTNQWKQSKRRCLRCQQSGVSTTLEERAERAAAEEEASAFARIHEERMAIERARVKEELARRNACERPDEECPICFDVIADAAMWAAFPCNAKHTVCKGCLREMAENDKANGKLSSACPHCRAEASLETLQPLYLSCASS